EDDRILAVHRGGGQGAVADPRDAFGLLADLDLAQRGAGAGVHDGNGAVVRVGDQQELAVGRDVEKAIRDAGTDDRADSEKGDKRKSEAHARTLGVRKWRASIEYIMGRVPRNCNEGEPCRLSLRERTRPFAERKATILVKTRVAPASGSDIHPPPRSS